MSDRGRRAIAHTLLNRGRRKLENLEINQGFGNSYSVANQSNLLEDRYNYTFPPLPNPYPQYQKCYRNDPLACDRPLETLKQAPLAKFCSQCGFPAQLPTNKEIRGRRGIYKVTNFLRRQGNGRIYAGRHPNSGEAIVIKEYLLPSRYFKELETRQKKEIFERVVNFQVAATTPSDFRLIIPSEGISDRNQDRCYLIVPGNLAALPNLKAYLAKQGRMEPQQVIKLLDQVLQSLEFLHSHKWQFSSGDIKQGLVHGRLSLDTLLISQTEVEFLVYLWDLSFWEDLFNPTLAEVSNKRVIDDLIALGNIGLYLLAPKEITVQTTYPLNPRDDLNWRGISLPLKSFLLKLLGLNSPFEDAASARRELRQLMLNQDNSQFNSLTPSQTSASADKTFNLLLWTILSVIILFLGGLIWWLISKPNQGNIETVSGDSCIKDIRNVPDGQFTYGIVSSEQPKELAAKKLKDIFNINDTYQNFCGSSDFASQSFTEIIRQIHELELTPSLEDNQKNLISNIGPRQIDFALVYLAPNEKQSILNKQQFLNDIIAYDGLLVYVPFVDCKNCPQLGEYLEEKITLEQLRKIYTGKVDYWHQINSNIPSNIEIKAFVPDDDSTIELFEKLLFKNPEDIKDFRQAIDSGKIRQQESYSILQEIRKLWQQPNRENETKKGGIGVDFQEIIYKQCNVYPLAVVRYSQEFFPMLINETTQKGVELFEDLSCQDKQNYQLNETLFRLDQEAGTGADQRYPLAFSLNLLYRKDDRARNLDLGKKITEIFKTQEFQCHLSHKKLIPLKLSEKYCER